MAFETYRATVNLPGLRAGETCRLDLVAAGDTYLRGWVRGKYLVKVKTRRSKGG